MTLHWQGAAVAFIALTLLEVIVSNPASAGQVGGIAAGAGTLVQKVLSPTVPAFNPAPAPIVGAGPGPGGAGTPAPGPPSNNPPGYTNPLPGLPGPFGPYGSAPLN